MASTMNNLAFECKAPRSFLQLVSRLLPIIHHNETRRSSHGFFSDLIS
jgi:hypothetical protein